ncbi:MAG: IS30 family transposase [Coxiella sp. (in: Bacteria)]|nr:MAG: IS30 family transposase [Coxiella sp. (in: g-proteobacteria)]
MECKKSYKQLTILDRARIYGLHEAGFTADQIATKLDRHRSTIYRELSRNSCTWLNEYRYFPNVAQSKAQNRRLRGLKLMYNEELRQIVTKYLTYGWSPEQIAGRLKKETGHTVISHETIYAYIYDKRAKDERLYLLLSKRRRIRMPRVSRNYRRVGPITDRRDITERPEIISSRSTFGHWEGDLILFQKTKSNLITLRERKSRFMFALLNPNKEAKNTSNAIIKHFGAKKPGLITTLTLDNGGEFACHKNIAKELKIDIFFCKPYASYQKGCVENGNRALRRYLPRHTEIGRYSQQKIEEITNLINNKPMKCLDYKTPAEVLLEEYGNDLGSFVAPGG